MNSVPPPSPTRPLRVLAWCARTFLWLVLGAWLLFALTWGTLHGLIVPRIGDWRPQLEAIASQALGVRVTVGEVRAESTGAIPAFELSDVRLLDAHGREALHLQRVLGTLSVQSLWQLGFEQLVIDAPTLDVRRTTDGRIQVAGIDVSNGPDQTKSDLGDWFFSQKEFVIRQGVLRWTDEQRPEAPPLELNAVNLVLRNPGRQHWVRLDATPPPEWGDRFSIRGRFRQPLWQLDSGAWQAWGGKAYGEFPRLSLHRLRQHLNPQEQQALRVQDGQGALRLWLDIQRGRVTDLTADASLRKVELQLRPDLQPLALDGLSGRLNIKQDELRLEVGTEQLAFRTREGRTWPGGNFRFEQTRDRLDQIQAMGLHATQLDLTALRQLSRHLPLDASAHRWLEELQPAGVVRTLDARWAKGDTGIPATHDQWSARGEIRDLTLKAVEQPAVPGSQHPPLGRPGLSGATVAFDVRETGGEAKLQLRNGQLEFPGVFEDPTIKLKQLEAVLQWKQQGDRIDLQVPVARFANADAQGEVHGSWHTSVASSPSASRFPGVLDLTAVMSRADGARVHRYLPLGISAAVRAYVRESVVSGQGSDVRFKVKGDLRHFPFEKEGTGEFSVRAKLANVDFNYVPPFVNRPGAASWPALQRLNTDFSIDRASMRFSNISASAAGAPQLRVTQGEAHFNNFLHTPELEVKARVQGRAADALAFVNRSPLGDMTGQTLKNASINGATDVQFQLNLPLQHAVPARVTGQVLFNGNDIRLDAASPRLERTTGRLLFTDRGFSLAQTSARLLGGDIKVDGGMRTVAGEALIQFKGQGTATADGLRQAHEWGWLAQLGRVSSGSTSYQAQLGFRGGHTELRVTSNLQGLAINLPAPLGKTAQTAQPLRYEIGLLPPPQAGQPTHDRLEVDIGPSAAPLASLRYERELGPGEPKVLRGALALSTHPSAYQLPAMPSQGVQAHLVLGQVDIGAWNQALSPPPSTGPTPPAPSTADLNRTMAYWPTVFALQAERIVHEGRSFNHVVAGGGRERDTWRLNVDAHELNGYLEYRVSRPNTPGRVYARLARLTLPPSTASEVETLLQQQPEQIPALDIVVGDFELNGRSLGRLEIEAINRGRGALTSRDSVREWRLNKLNLTVPEAQLQASGNWTLLGAQASVPGTSGPSGSEARRTVLGFKLDIRDSGSLLARFGMPDVIRGGKGQLQGTIGWLGSPLQLHYPSLGGQLALALERGQFLKADPGLAKLLGVLSLQSLPRRLTLDFRDVFSEGFAFDFVRGDVGVAQGVASTNNLQMKGVNAAVLIEGSANLAHETQDITAVVVPELNAGTASLIASAINPAVGLGSFLAQFLLGRPLKEAATQQFHITGTWSDPKVEKVSRQSIIRDTPQKGDTP